MATYYNGVAAGELQDRSGGRLSTELLLSWWTAKASALLVRGGTCGFILLALKIPQSNGRSWQSSAMDCVVEGSLLS